MTGEEYRELMAKLAEKDKRIDILRAEHDYLMDGSRELKAELDEKDTRIAELKAENEYLLNEGENIGVE